MPDKMAAKRQSNIDLLRITACFMVVLLHVAGAYWGWGDMYRTGWTGIATYAVVTRSCVPLFVMISGKLFLERNSMVPLRKLFLNNVLKLVVLYVVWGLFYAVDDLGVRTVLAGGWRELPRQFASAPYYHLWYLPMQTCLYLMLPLFWAVAKHDQGKHLGYVCAVLCAYSIVNDTLMLFVPANELLASFLGKYVPNQELYWAYFLLGYYVSNKKWEKLKAWHCLLAFFVFAAAAAAYTIWSSRTSGVYDNKLLDSYPLTTLVAAVALFLAYLKMPCNFTQRTEKTVRVISRCTLFIYLIHPFVLGRLNWLGINAEIFNPWLSVPVVAVIAFVLCLIPALVLTRIPVVNKWLL